MSADDRCALSYETLLEHTSTEQHRWHDWFVEHSGAWAVPFATGRMATIGGVVMHIFAVELRYSQRLLDQQATDWEDSGRLPSRMSLSLATMRAPSWCSF